jgi:dihydroneopterin aldolase
MSRMLASVRSAAEAKLALRCGVDWLDVKDPAAGALGRPAATVVADIVALAGTRVPVSATIGDCWHTPGVIPERVAAMAGTGVGYVKIGLAARGLDADALACVRASTSASCRVVAVCLAECPPARADILALARQGIAGIMLDTANKAGQRLTDLVSAAYLGEFVATARERGLLTGLAGRLALADVPVLLPLGPDYLGFRSALCDGGRREAPLARRAVLAVRAAMRPQRGRGQHGKREVA